MPQSWNSEQLMTEKNTGEQISTMAYTNITIIGLITNPLSSGDMVVKLCVVWDSRFSAILTRFSIGHYKKIWSNDTISLDGRSYCQTILLQTQLSLKTRCIKTDIQKYTLYFAI